MSDAPRPPEPEESPSADELRRIALPAHVRRAPRFRTIIGTGIVAGFIVGALCGLLLPNSTATGRGTVALVIGLGFALIGALVTSLIAIGLDRDTPRYLKTAPDVEWLDDLPPAVPGSRRAGSDATSHAPTSGADQPEPPLRPAEYTDRKPTTASAADDPENPEEERP